MRWKSILICGCVFVLAAALSAQTKFSAKETCAKPDPQYGAPVGDKPDHAISLGKTKCTWSAGEIGGVKFQESEDTVISDSSGSSSADRGYAVLTLADGDKAFVRFEGKSTVKDKMPTDGKGTWSFVGGSGKLKGIKGKGTFSGKWNADGTGAFDVEGEYTLAAAKAGK